MGGLRPYTEVSPLHPVLPSSLVAIVHQEENLKKGSGKGSKRVFGDGVISAQADCPKGAVAQSGERRPESNDSTKSDPA